jgi:chromosomal replication initiator protein
LKSEARPNYIAHPRQVAMYLARTLTRHSLQSIGFAFGGRDHGTVIHACKAVEVRMEMEPETQKTVTELKAILTADGNVSAVVSAIVGNTRKEQ